MDDRLERKKQTAQAFYHLMFNIFRFDANGRIVEHWDVLQRIPERSEHGNTMF